MTPLVTTAMCLETASIALVSTAIVDRRVDGDRDRRLERVVALQPGQLDDLLDQPREPLALDQHPVGEALDRLGVVGGVVHGLGQQPDRADGGLQLVADVADEVAAYGLDPALAGAVLDQRQHQPRAERRDPGGHVARRHAGAGHHQLGLADLPVAAYLLDQRRELGRDQLAARGPAPWRTPARRP